MGMPPPTAGTPEVPEAAGRWNPIEGDFLAEADVDAAAEVAIPCILFIT